MRRWCIGVLVCVMEMLVGGPSAIGALEFHWIDPLPGDGHTPQATLSGDGAVLAVGSRPAGGVQSRVFLWTAQGASAPLPIPTGYTSLGMQASNFDGTMCAGVAILGTVAQQAVTWTAQGGTQFLPLPAGVSWSRASGMSRNGARIVGYSPFEALLWNNGAASVLPSPPLSSSTTASAIDAAGNTIVGTSIVNGRALPCKWTTSSELSLMPTLNNLPYGEAASISADGSVVVGTGGSFPFTSAVRWTASGVESLGLLPGSNAAVARAVSADGGVIVGNSGDGSVQHGFIWTAATGMLDVQTLVTASGVNLGSNILHTVTDVSDDGRTIAGMATFVLPSGYVTERAWIATVPAPATGVAMTVAGAFLARRRRAAVPLARV